MMERVVGLIAADYQRPIGPVVIAVVLTAAATLEARKTAGPFGPDVALTIGLLATAPIAVIRRFPTAAIAIVLAANAAFVMFARLSWSVAAVVGWLGALVAAPILLPRRRAAMAVALTEAAVLLGVTGLNGNVTPWDATAAEALAVLAAWGAGEMVRARRQAGADRAAAAEQLRLLSEREVVARERASIARELHDVVAHHVSMIAVRAATAPYTVPELPEPGRKVLAEIADEARTALTELRVVLGVLRSPDGGLDAAPRGVPGGRSPGLAPQPRIADLDCLIQRMISAGMDVMMTVSGPARPLPGSAELCCYRVVQEGLTNAGKYAQGSKVRVGLTFASASVTAEVINSAVLTRGDDPPEPPAGPARRGDALEGGEQVGFGLTGLRERVAMLHGEFQARPTADGGFTVRAVLPAPAIDSAEPEPEAAPAAAGEP